jgi:hypothetical protein
VGGPYGVACATAELEGDAERGDGSGWATTPGMPGELVNEWLLPGVRFSEG